jgi:hypothetical protein
MKGRSLTGVTYAFQEEKERVKEVAMSKPDPTLPTSRIKPSRSTASTHAVNFNFLSRLRFFPAVRSRGTIASLSKGRCILMFSISPKVGVSGNTEANEDRSSINLSSRSRRTTTLPREGLDVGRKCCDPCREGRHLGADNGGRWKQQRRAEGRSEQSDQIR